MNTENKQTNLFRTEKNLIEVCYKTKNNTAKAVETALEIFENEGFKLEELHVRHYKKNNEKRDSVYEFELPDDAYYYELYQIIAIKEEN